MKGLWVTAGPVASEDIILHLHGGGYISGSPKTHRRLVARLCQMTGLRGFLPAYPLAPEHPAPAASDAALAAWRYLVAAGHSPDRIVLGGDSAGGGVALALLSHLCREGTPPKAVYAFSPWTDLTLSGGSITENAGADPIFPVQKVAFLRDLVIGALAPDDPRISPLFATFSDRTPVYMSVGSTELLRDDTLRMADVLRATGAQVEVDIGDGTPHDWPIFQGWLPEADASLAKLGAFLKSL